MFQGSQQGGGGNQLTFLTGLFLSPKGNASGTVTPDKFAALFKLMQEAHQKGVGLSFVVVNKPQQGKLVAHLMVAVSNYNKQQQSMPTQTATNNPFATSVTGTPTAPAGPGWGQPPPNLNPPKDELDAALEEI